MKDKPLFVCLIFVLRIYCLHLEQLSLFSSRYDPGIYLAEQRNTMEWFISKICGLAEIYTGYFSNTFTISRSNGRTHILIMIDLYSSPCNLFWILPYHHYCSQRKRNCIKQFYISELLIKSINQYELLNFAVIHILFVTATSTASPSKWVLKRHPRSYSHVKCYLVPQNCIR
jgi:hypothetical protein